MADSVSRVAPTSANTRLRGGSDAGDYPDSRVFCCWHLVGEAFSRAKGSRSVTVVTSGLHSLTSPENSSRHLRLVFLFVISVKSEGSPNAPHESENEEDCNDPDGPIWMVHQSLADFKQVQH